MGIDKLDFGNMEETFFIFYFYFFKIGDVIFGEKKERKRQREGPSEGLETGRGVLGKRLKVLGGFFIKEKVAILRMHTAGLRKGPPRGRKKKVF